MADGQVGDFMESKELIIATWILVVFTGVLAGATIAYAITTWKLYRGSQHQVEALTELTKAVLQLPGMDRQIQLQKKLAEEREKARAKNQRNALRGF